MPDAPARDHQRQAAYTAEILAWEHTTFEEPVGLAVLAELAAEVLDSPWWRRRAPAAVLRVVAARRDARRSTVRLTDDGSWLLRVAPGHDTPATLAHELAHVWIGPHDITHGPEFRRRLLGISGQLLGADAAGWLAQAYGDLGLPVAPGAGFRPPALGAFGRWLVRRDTAGLLPRAIPLPPVGATGWGVSAAAAPAAGGTQPVRHRPAARHEFGGASR